MRARGEGSLYQRKRDLRWVAAISMADGRRVERTALTKEAAAEHLRDLRRLRDAGADRVTNQTLADFLDGWIRRVEPRMRPATWRSYEKHVRNWLIPGLGRHRLDRLGVPEVDTFLSGLPLAPRTVSHVRATLRRALADAVREGRLARNVGALSHPPRVPSQQAKAWTAGELRMFLDHAAEDRLYPLWVTAATTGLRQAELLGLPWSNVDLEKRQLVVDRTLVRHDGNWAFAEAKTTRSKRTVPLPEMTVAVLRRWQTAQKAERLAHPPYPYHGLVFTTRDGEPIHGSNLLPPFHRAQQRAGVPRIPFHGLRHTFASVLLARGVSPRVVMELLGHSTIRVTMDVYAHVAAEDTRKAAEALAELL